MSKEIRFNAFAMNCVGHMAPGLWRHPRDRSDRYIDLNYWTELAALLERGKFDGLFLADVLGPYDVYQGRADPAIHSGIQIPVNAELGRGQLLIFAMLTIIVAPTEAEAVEKLHEYRSYIDYEGALVLMSGWTGVDLSTYDLDEELRPTKTNANQSALESFTVGEPDRRWKIREIAEFVGLGGRGPVVVGPPTQVADLLQQRMEETDVDGFNLTYAVMPETYQNIIDLLIPELQRRGVYKKEYRPGSLREKLFGQGPFLPETHPGRRC